MAISGFDAIVSASEAAAKAAFRSTFKADAALGMTFADAMKDSEAEAIAAGNKYGSSADPNLSKADLSTIKDAVLNKTLTVAGRRYAYHDYVTSFAGQHYKPHDNHNLQKAGATVNAMASVTADAHRLGLEPSHLRPEVKAAFQKNIQAVLKHYW